MAAVVNFLIGDLHNPAAATGAAAISAEEVAKVRRSPLTPRDILLERERIDISTIDQRR
jgi:hypothetical protein